MPDLDQRWAQPAEEDHAALGSSAMAQGFAAPRWLSVRGTVADDLHDAFAEFEAGTRCLKPLYSLSFNPSSPLSREQ